MEEDGDAFPVGLVFVVEVVVEVLEPVLDRATSCCPLAADGSGPSARWVNVHVTVSPSCSATDADASAALVFVSPLGSSQARVVSVRGCPFFPPVSWSW